MAQYDDFEIVEDEIEQKKRPFMWIWLGIILLLLIVFGFAAGIAYSSLTERWADEPTSAAEIISTNETTTINEPEFMTVTLNATVQATVQVIAQATEPTIESTSDTTAVSASETSEWTATPATAVTQTATSSPIPTTTPLSPTVEASATPVDTATPLPSSTLTLFPTETATLPSTATFTPVPTETPLPTVTATVTNAATEPPSPTPLPPPTAAPSEPSTQNLPPAALLANLEGVRSTVNGRFLAAYNNDIRLDGRIEEWSNRPTAWRPMKFVVHGGQYFDGPADLSAGFQTAWSDQGLYLALIVLDELHRSGPSNEEMWMGDGLEIHFDQQLRADFDGRKADGDDYQIGVNFGPHLDHFNGYRWLPAAQSGQVPITGAIASAAGGYVIEILIAWEVFGLSTAEVYPGDVYGFNISINDNDSDQPAQQTMISASAQRTTFDDPTEWGTLLLGR